jgi:hypothetical protein
VIYMAEPKDLRIEVLDRIYSRCSMTEREIEDMFGEDGIVAAKRLQGSGYVEKKEDKGQVSYEIPDDMREVVTEIVMDKHGISLGISSGGYFDPSTGHWR